jgi:hypothetical protein
MNRNREAAITKISDELFRGARGILANGNNGESVTESLDRTDSVRDNQLVYSEEDTTLFFSIFGLDIGDQCNKRSKPLVNTSLDTADSKLLGQAIRI